MRLLLPTVLSLATTLAPIAGLAELDRPLSFDSCADLSIYLQARQPHESIRLAPNTYTCDEPPTLSVDGLSVDFGGSLIRVADNALRPGILVGDLHTPPRQRHHAITVRNLKIDGNRANQPFECWAGPCDPSTNDNPLWQQRLNGITVNGCDDCAVIDVEIVGARSGGVVVVSSNRLLIDGMEAKRSHFDGLAAYRTRDSTFRNLRVNDNDYAGFSFDCEFSGNLIEEFEASQNGDHGIFIRQASGNTFSIGSLTDNGQDGIYFDRSIANDMRTCASDTTLEHVTVSGSGRFGAWLDFACHGNGFSASSLFDNGRGCFGGRAAELIERSADTECIGSERSEMFEAKIPIDRSFAAANEAQRRSCPHKSALAPSKRRG